jgi:hypothetical protein
MGNKQEAPGISTRDNHEHTYVPPPQEILSREELIENGFIPVSHPAYVIDPISLFQVKDGDVNVKLHKPQLSKKYLLGKCLTSHVKYNEILEIPRTVKTNMTTKMYLMGIKWVYKVYLGETFIDDDMNQYYHIYCMGNILNNRNI